MKKVNLKDLINSGQLQEEPAIGKDQVTRFLLRAEKDLAASEHIKNFDEAIAMQAAYDGMFHAANSLIRLHGYRPGATRQHQGVITAISRILGEDASILIKRFDRLRKRRNEFEYQGLYEMGTEEFLEALSYAKKFVALIRKEVKNS
ncbi:MAG: HEPN domain-containing protein [Elusimicrobiota bacterium]